MYRKSSMTSAIVLLVIAALVVFIGYGSSIDGKWFQQSDMSKWYNSWGKGEPVQTNDQTDDNTQTDNQNGSQNGNQNGNVTPVQTGTSNNMIVSDSEGFGLTLLCAPIDDLTVVSLADSTPANYVAAYSLTVTYTPSYANAPAIDWSVAFQNPNSTWANGKTVSNYVVVVPSENGSLYATAYCLAAFGEKIVISVTSRIDSNVTSSVVCDYVASVSSIEYHAGTSNQDNYFVLASGTAFQPKAVSGSGRGFFSNGYDAQNGHVELNYINEPRTLDNSVVSYTCSIAPNQNFLSALNNAGLTVRTTIGPGNPFNYNGGYGYASFIARFVSDSFEEQGAFNSTNYNKFLTACQNMANNGYIAFTVTLSAQLTYGSSVSTTFNVYVDDSSSVFLADSLSFNQASLVFYFAENGGAND